MKVPFTWLKEFVPIKASAEEVARRLTFAGLEVEGIEDVAGDPVLEVNVTPNRGDCLSLLGIAREVSALLGVPLKKIPPVQLAPAGQEPSLKKMVSVSSPKACPRYLLAVIDGVAVGPSPEWLSRRLEQAGIRSINNVVDVTNYFLIAFGQPMHAFDRAKIRGGKVLVRVAKAGEKLRTLDGQERTLQTSDLVIADNEGPIALAGIMGGKDSEVDEKTASIALECAFFEPSDIRKTGRRLGLQTESSQRFERHVDGEGLTRALNEAVALILKIAGGRLIGPVIDVKKGKSRKQILNFDPASVAQYLGGSWEKPKIKQALQRLTFGVAEKGKTWQVTVPSCRSDVTRTVDVIEEVARLIGYDKIPTVFPPLTAAPAPGEAGLRKERRVKELLSDLGFRETIHYSFMAPGDVHGLTGLDEGEGVLLQNPLGQEYALMRPSLLPSLLKTAAHHQNHKMNALRLYEFRKCFRSKDGKISEWKSLAGLVSGPRLLTYWETKAEETDFFDIKGIVERVAALTGVSPAFESGRAPYLHPRKQAAVLVDGRTAGVVGEIHPDLVGAFELTRTAYVFELDWQALTAKGSLKKAYAEFGRTPVVERDLALVADDEVTAGSLQNFLQSADPAVQDVGVFDLYRGNPIPAGKKSLAFTIRIGKPDRTLTEEQVNEIYSRLVEGVKKSFNVEVR